MKKLRIILALFLATATYTYTAGGAGSGAQTKSTTTLQTFTLETALAEIKKHTHFDGGCLPLPEIADKTPYKEQQKIVATFIEEENHRKTWKSIYDFGGFFLALNTIRQEIERITSEEKLLFIEKEVQYIVQALVVLFLSQGQMSDVTLTRQVIFYCTAAIAQVNTMFLRRLGRALPIKNPENSLYSYLHHACLPPVTPKKSH